MTNPRENKPLANLANLSNLKKKKVLDLILLPSPNEVFPKKGG
jgi:hypothetical protein